jgi:hypothetical protein
MFVFFGLQTLPTIYVDNNSEQMVQGLSFTFDGYVGKEPIIKKVNRGGRDQATIYTHNISGTKTLMMKHVTPSGEVKQYPLFDGLNSKYWGEILVDIRDVKDDGTLEFTVRPNPAA